MMMSQYTNDDTSVPESPHPTQPPVRSETDNPSTLPEHQENCDATHTPSKTDSSKTRFLTGLLDQAAKTAKTITSTAQEVAQATATTTTAGASNITQVGKAIAQTTTEKSKDAVSAIGSGLSSMGSSLGDGASKANKAIAHGVDETKKGSQTIVRSLGSRISTGTDQTGQLIVDTVSHATSNAGNVMGWIKERSHLQQLTRAIKVDWLVSIIDTVNVNEVENRVQALKQKHPEATSYQLAGRIMATKSLIVGGSGLASSLLPGAAAAMVAFDLAATTAIQAEMGYEIAAAYGLDVHAPARKGEILAIFGLALGSSQALKTGFTYLARNVPIAGAVVGASTNAVALYAVGHAACQFYEAKLNDQALVEQNSTQALSPSQEDHLLEAEVEAVTVQQKTYFEEAIAQQMIMDQLFAHMLKAGHPEKSWSELVPILEDLHFSPASLQLIAHSLDHPTQIEDLLNQVNSEFAIPLLAQCQRLADEDGIRTAKEQALLDLMAQTLASSHPSLAEIVDP